MSNNEAGEWVVSVNKGWVFLTHEELAQLHEEAAATAKSEELRQLEELERFLASMHENEVRSNRFDVQDMLGYYTNYWPMDDATTVAGIRYLKAQAAWMRKEYEKSQNG
jgi:hypothetical protein